MAAVSPCEGVRGSDPRNVAAGHRPHHRIEIWLQYADGFVAAQSFGSAESLYRRIADLQAREEAMPWDLVLMDIQLPGRDGIEATRRLKEIARDVPVVMLTVLEDPPLILEAIGAGADGYLLKKAGTREMLSALRDILEGGAVLTPAVARHVLQRMRLSEHASRTARARPDLTNRETDVLQCLVDGLTCSGSADRLQISFEKSGRTFEAFTASCRSIMLDRRYAVPWTIA